MQHTPFVKQTGAATVVPQSQNLAPILLVFIIMTISNDDIVVKSEKGNFSM